MKLIISANDGSQGADRALAFAAHLAKAFDAKLLIVHVSEEILSQTELRQLEQLRVSEGDALEEISRRVLLKAREAGHDNGAMNTETMTAAEIRRKCLSRLHRRKTQTLLWSADA